MINARYGKPKKLKGIEQSLFLTFRYKQNIVDAIRKITPRYWHNEEKMWEIEYSALSELKELLPKEQFDVYGDPISPKKYGEKIVDHTITLPKALTTKLYPYQKETFDEGMAFDRYIYNLDQGLGKTNCTIATILKRIELGQINKVLILPAMNLLKYTWENEVNKHTTGVKCKILGNRQNSKGIWLTKGTKEKLEDLNNLENDVSIYVTNIESIREKTITDKLVKLMDKGVFNCIVVDESHKIVSPSAQQSKALLRLTNHVKYVYLLTGTILMNRPDDLYIPLKITGAFTGNFSNFRSRYDILGGFGNYQVVGHKHLDELQAKLISVSKRLRKADVLKQLPPKIYVEEFLDMSVKQKKIYKDVLNAIMADIDNIKLSINPLSQMIRLRQATADTSILSSTVKESVKFDRALELIQEIIERNESVIVFSCWETVVSNFRKFLSDNHLISAVITGKIKDREGQIKYFNEKDDCHIIVGTVGAMGVGLTLNKASNVIFLDESWSASEKLQCEDRCHRIGQTETVTVITLVCKHTIDENIHSIVKRKGALGDALVDHKYDLKDEKVLNYLLTGEGELG
jgi:SNF2 family DNA or RNA helicase